ncbi:MAG: hypothetical protein OHK0046_47330 [Anaerolineae bacterium]
MSSPDILFKGIPRTPTRTYTSNVLLRVRPSKVVIPCTGSFPLAYTARAAGVPARDIVCGDISLYSTALAHAINDTDWRLDIRDDAPHADVIAPYMSTPLDKAAAVLLMIRILQYDRKEQKVYHLHRQRELIRNAPTYIDQLRVEIEAMRANLAGLTYLAQDMWATMEDELNEDGTVNLINPPRYTGGYDRMFRGIDDVFDWDEPQAAQFTERDYPRLMDMLKEKPALSLMYYATEGEDPAPMWGDPWRSVFADRPNSMGVAAINWIIANDNPVGVRASRGSIKVGEAKYPLFKGDITPDSQIKAIRTDKVTGDYYRDLFVHKLPASTTEVYVLILVDGYLMSIVGMNLADLRRGKVVTKGEKVLDQCVSVTFAFTCPHPHDRLHKLTLMSITSEWFWQDVLGHENWYELNGMPRHIKTTMLTPHPEVKSARGIMKLDTREPQKEGGYKLTYSTPTNQMTRQETLETWLKKHSKK